MNERFQPCLCYNECRNGEKDMGKKVRVWFMRIIALVLVALMVITLGANLFTTSSNKEEKTSQTTKKKSKYTYVSSDSKYHLDGINQDLLLPEGMTKQSESTNDQGATVSTFSAVKYEDLTASLVITKAESSQGVNMDSYAMATMEQMADGLKNNGEYSNKNYITFRGESNNYLEQVQTLLDNGQYAYEIDYNIYDLNNKNYYMISLFLVNPENPTKTDLLHLDRMGKEMMSKTSYMAKEIYSEFALPADAEYQFNHLK